MVNKKRLQFVSVFILLILVGLSYGASDFSKEIKSTLKRNEIEKDICVVLCLPTTQLDSFLSEFVTEKELIVYFQSPDPDEIAIVRRAAEEREFLGNRVFVEEGDFKSIHLASNLAGMVFVCAQVYADKIKGKLRALVALISQYSLGIYLLHPLLLLPVRDLENGFYRLFISNWLAIPIITIVIMFIALLSTMLLVKIPLLRRLVP